MRQSIVRGRLLASTLLVSVAGFAASAAAQEAAQEAQEQEAADELIVVTGSRIASAISTSAAPLQVVNDAVIDDAGVTNIQELLLENPAFGTPALSRTNSAFLTSGTGVATVDLRDLGSDRTLVLVNGRRVVAGLPGSAIVDLNVIPTQFIQNVDILTGGASSLYGSDAIAGVVNFVYKSDFEGLEANGQYGITEEGDDERYQANVTVGTNFADGRGNIMVHFGYSSEGGVLSRERSNTAVDDFDGFALTGDPTQFGVPTEPFFSSFPPQGRFITAGGTFTFGPTGNLQPCFTTNGTTCGGGAGAGPNGFNRQAFRTIAVPVDRYLFATAGSYEFTDKINFFFEGTFNRTESSRIIEPFASQSSGVNGIFPGSGQMPVEHFIVRDRNGDGVADPVAERQIEVNPLVPGAIVAAAADTDGLRDIGFVRRLSEFGNRTGETSRDFYRFVLGFDGTLFDDKFRWDVSYNYGQTVENQTSNGQVNVVNFRDALAVMVDADDVNGNGNTAEFVCISAEARASGCVPANIFGTGNVSPGAVAFINAQGTFQTSIKQQVVQGNLSGSLFELPAGPLGIATGFEYRKEESSSDNDSLTNQGLNAGNALPDTRGSFDVVEGYLEVKVPILADTPGFKLLEVGGSIRVADYSTVGSVYSYSGTATWQPIDDIRFRGTYSRAVRAPNIGELFAGLSQTFPPGLQDPCVGVTATSTGTTSDFCRASPGVNANIAANGGVFTLNQADRQGISGFNGGNPNLFEEKADSYTLGAVINPVSLGLNNLTITIDYYNIDVTDVISAPPRAFTLDQCFNKNNQPFCQLVVRRPTATAVNSAGSIQFVNALQINGAKLKTDGLDVTASYRTGLDGIGVGGNLSGRIAYTHVFSNDFFPAVGEPADPSAGEIGTAKDRFTANLRYDSDGGFRASLTGTYIGKSYEDDQFCAAFGLNPKCVGVGAQFYLDTQVGWNVNDNFEFYAGVDNVLDDKAPNLLSGTTFNVTGTDTAADVYDVFGRRFYAGVRLTF